MNRRNFLKSIAAVCGAAVVCPGELLKDKSAVQFRPNPIQKDIIIANARQTGYTAKIPWKHYYITYHYSQKQLMTKLEGEFWNTKFKSPLIEGIDETTKT